MTTKLHVVLMLTLVLIALYASVATSKVMYCNFYFLHIRAMVTQFSVKIRRIHYIYINVTLFTLLHS